MGEPKSVNYELLYQAVKSVLRRNIKHAENPFTRAAYDTVLNQMESLEKIGGDIRKISIEKIFINGDPVQ